MNGAHPVLTCEASIDVAPIEIKLRSIAGSERWEASNARQQLLGTTSSAIPAPHSGPIRALASSPQDRRAADCILLLARALHVCVAQGRASGDLQRKLHSTQPYSTRAVFRSPLPQRGAMGLFDGLLSAQQLDQGVSQLFSPSSRFLASADQPTPQQPAVTAPQIQAKAGRKRKQADAAASDQPAGPSQPAAKSKKARAHKQPAGEPAAQEQPAQAKRSKKPAAEAEQPPAALPAANDVHQQKASKKRSKPAAGAQAAAEPVQPAKRRKASKQAGADDAEDDVAVSYRVNHSQPAAPRETDAGVCSLRRHDV